MREFKNIRTDLALEEKEKYEQNNVEIEGIKIDEDWFVSNKNEEKIYIKKTLVDIVSSRGAEAIGRDIGRYITLEWGDLVDENTYNMKKVNGVAEVVKNELLSLLKNISISKSFNILIVGLGNKDITPDAIGPLVVKDIYVNRHLQGIDKKNLILKYPVVSALAPGVMGQTGMEVSEIVKALVDNLCIDVVVIVDALAARSVSRLNKTIQITDTGIAPGSGVGNNRAALNKSSLGVEVIAIGVPTVVDAYTIMYDMVSSFLEKEGCNEQEIGNFVDEVKNNSKKNMIVTCTDIDEVIKDVTGIISDGINEAVAAYSYI
jgi:spore protease